MEKGLELGKVRDKAEGSLTVIGLVSGIAEGEGSAGALVLGAWCLVPCVSRRGMGIGAAIINSSATNLELLHIL